MVSGSGKAVVLATGDGTYVASLMRQLPSGHVMNAFDYAVRRIVYLFIGFILVMVPLVIVLNGTTTCEPPSTFLSYGLPPFYEWLGCLYFKEDLRSLQYVFLQGQHRNFDAMD